MAYSVVRRFGFRVQCHSRSLRTAFAQRISQKYYSTLPVEATVARYVKNGPTSVVELRKEPLPGNLSSSDVLIKMLYAPVNTADIQVIVGKNPTQPPFPAIGGSEGVGQVIAVGDKSTFKVGDLVFPAKPFFGTWRTYAQCDQSELIAVPPAKDVPHEYLSSLSVSPVIAYCLLNNFVTLKEGDVIIQNGANSMVGLTVTQLAHARGIKTINVIRSRSDYKDIVPLMKDYGAYIACADNYIRTAEFRSLISDLPKPKLALNCVGGDTATEFARLLEPCGTLVTYGGMSLKPVTVPTSSLIFNNITLKGFHLSDWYSKTTKEQRLNVLTQLITTIQLKKLRLWVERIPFDDFKTALKRAEKTHERSRKVILAF